MIDIYICIWNSRKGGDTLENEVIRGQTLLCVILVFTWTHIPGHQFAAKEKRSIGRCVEEGKNLRDLLLGPNDCYVPPSQPKRRSHSWGALLFKMRADSSNPCCVTLTCLFFFLKG